MQNNSACVLCFALSRVNVSKLCVPEFLSLRGSRPVWITRDIVYLTWKMEMSSRHMIFTLRRSVLLIHVVLDLLAHLVGTGQQPDIYSPHRLVLPLPLWAECVFISVVKSASSSCRVTCTTQLGCWEPVRDQRGSQLVLWVPICHCSPSAHHHRSSCPAGLSPARDVETKAGSQLFHQLPQLRGVKSLQESPFTDIPGFRFSDQTMNKAGVCFGDQECIR